MRSILFSLFFLSTACSGVAGTIDNSDGISRTVDLSGSIFAWVDQSDGDLTSWESPRLMFAFSGLSFDPESDLLAKSGSELADLQLRFATSDVAALVVPDASRHGEAGTIEAELVPGAFACPPVNQPLINEHPLGCFSAAPEVLEADAEFSGFAPVGRKATMTIELDAGARQTGETISGNFTLVIEALESDPDGALTGTISGPFSTTLLGERIAERNIMMLLGARP